MNRYGSLPCGLVALEAKRRWLDYHTHARPLGRVWAAPDP